ncbi:heparinase II/III family protein [Actinoplanes sp. LDG1-06]|uniref:Heparinase II/III family protein n=1 Tax=Paractinoplanes ovalisporus TaxID=2810368 RepID=A0ABS2A5E9_9ACTN|nr:heparinase II/III family protein [Actinoplanes ovalisporus]MBM2615067.1 heparinase II/III family protein [Actinoplanes ovalisporus]
MTRLTALLSPLLSSVVVFAPAAPATAADGVNLVPNPGFEVASPPAENCLIPSWCTPYQSETYAVDTETKASGARSMRIDGSATRKIGGFVTVPLAQATLPVVRISAKVKLDRVTLADYTDFPGGARVSLSFSYVNAGQTVYTGSGVLGGIMTGTRDWTTVSGTFRVPPLTTRVQIINSVQTSTGTMWVDDVEVVGASNWVTPDDMTKTVAAGGSATYLLAVTNRRTVADSLALTADGDTTVEPATTPVLQPGASATVKVTVRAQDAATVTNVRITPTGDAALTQVARLTTKVAEPAAGPQEPHVYNTVAQLQALRTRIGGQAWARNAFTTVVKAEADAWLDRPLDKTVFHGGWSGNFKCPGTNTMLTFDYNSPGSHVCPIDGKRYSGEPYDSAWTEIWHNNAAQAASDLALTYQMLPASDPDRPKYAAKARDILRYYAVWYLSVPLNGLYGRVHYQSLDEAVAAIGLIDAYDLIRSTLTAADRVDIENNLLRVLAETVAGNPMATSNFQAWHDAAIYGVGAAVDDSGLRAAALDDTNWLLDHAVLKDGWWWEGAASYHLYAMQALTQVVIAARNQPGGPDLTGDPRFKRMQTAILPYLYPDTTVPASGDGGTWGRKFGPNFAQFAEWAYAEYRDPQFAVGLAYSYQNLKNPRVDRFALRYGADTIPASTGVRQPSTTLPGLGETVLRSGAPDNLLRYGNVAVLPREGAATLRLTAMVKGSGKLTLTFTDNHGRMVGSKSVPAGPTSGWAASDTRVDVPATATRVRLRVDRTLEADQLDLWSENLLDDGGFEGRAAGWTAAGQADRVPTAYRGERAARLRSGSWSQLVPVNGTTGRLTLQARVRSLGASATARFELEFRQADGSAIATRVVKLEVRPGFVLRSLAADVPKDAAAVQVTLAAADLVGSAVFDDVTLTADAALDPFQVDAVRLDHGVPGGTHGHADKLHLDVVGGGGLPSTDLSQVYGADNADLTDNWYRESVSHNTVVVDGRSQDRKARGRLLAFGETPGLRVADADTTTAYADVSLRRSVLMADGYALDVVDASSPAPHTYDQSWHGDGALEVGGVTMGAPACGEPGCALDPENRDNGYHRLAMTAQGNAADGLWRATWKSPTTVLEMRALQPGSTTLLQSQAPGVATTGQPIPFLLARREAVRDARFTTLLETRSVTEGPVVKQATRISDDHVRVDRTDGGRDDLLFRSPAGGGGYALVRDGRDVSLVRSTGVALDGTTLVTASRRLDSATIERAGGDLTVTASAAAGPVTLRVFAPGVRTVTLNGERTTFRRDGNYAVVTLN